MSQRAPLGGTLVQKTLRRKDSPPHHSPSVGACFFSVLHHFDHTYRLQHLALSTGSARSAPAPFPSQCRPSKPRSAGRIMDSAAPNAGFRPHTIRRTVFPVPAPVSSQGPVRTCRVFPGLSAPLPAVSAGGLGAQTSATMPHEGVDGAAPITTHGGSVATIAEIMRTTEEEHRTATARRSFVDALEEPVLFGGMPFGYTEDESRKRREGLYKLVAQKKMHSELGPRSVQSAFSRTDLARGDGGGGGLTPLEAVGMSSADASDREVLMAAVGQAYADVIAWTDELAGDARPVSGRMWDRLLEAPVLSVDAGMAAAEPNGSSKAVP